MTAALSAASLVLVEREEDMSSAYSLLDIAARSLLNTYGLTHWLYPGKTPELVRRLATNATSRVYILLSESQKPVGTFTISSVPLSAYYDPLSWQEPDANAAYLANLAVAEGSKGVGSALVRAAASEAKRLFQSRWLRCDAVAEHPLLAGFYLKLGFERRGTPARLPLKNPFFNGKTAIEGPPGMERYTINATRPPTDSEFAIFTCQSWELCLEPPASERPGGQE
jgi:GNAT superfamily N-acetyltransferase